MAPTKKMTGIKSRKVSNKSRRRSSSKKTKKRAPNPFFKLMLNAKRKNMPSFKYKTKTYKGVKHPHLGMIYRKA
jgi:hypothetical protein